MCAGKGLAMVEMRSVVAHTVHKFDMHLPENVKGGFDMEKFFRQSTDHFTVGLPKIEVVFTERRK
jgi:cytochrome P450